MHLIDLNNLIDFLYYIILFYTFSIVAIFKYLITYFLKNLCTGYQIRPMDLYVYNYSIPVNTYVKIKHLLIINFA